MIRRLRISHPAFFGIKTAGALRFYTELLGLELPPPPELRPEQPTIHA